MVGKLRLSCVTPEHGATAMPVASRITIAIFTEVMARLLRQVIHRCAQLGTVVAFPQRKFACVATSIDPPTIPGGLPRKRGAARDAAEDSARHQAGAERVVVARGAWCAAARAVSRATPPAAGDTVYLLPGKRAAGTPAATRGNR